MRYYAGIDPGFTGAIAILDENGNVFEVHDLPTLEEFYTKKGKKKKRPIFDLVELARLINLFPATTCTIVIEKVTARPKQGVTSTFRFGHGLGIVEGMLAMRRILPAPSLIQPEDWKAKFDLINKEKVDSIDKAKELIKYANKYLILKKHHNRADAILMAKYGMDNEQLLRIR